MKEQMYHNNMNGINNNINNDSDSDSDNDNDNDNDDNNDNDGKAVWQLHDSAIWVLSRQADAY